MAAEHLQDEWRASDPEGGRAVFHREGDDYELMEREHNRQCVIEIDGARWWHTADDPAGRWIYRQ